MNKVFGGAFSKDKSPKEPELRKFVDIKDMPNYNPIVRDHVESVSKGELKILNGTPHCKKHGAMNKVSKDGIWRCLMCGVGCFELRKEQKQ